MLCKISLRNLSLRGNPCAHSEAYSVEVASALPRLEVFDDKVRDHSYSFLCITIYHSRLCGV